MRFQLGIATCVLAAGLQPGAVFATYSIAGVDMLTQEVGGAITSCVGTLDVGIVYGALPGVGVIHAQAQLDQRGRAKSRALELLRQGMDPKDIIVEITQPSFDPSYASRQYGLVDAMGRSAGYTGAQAQAYKHDQQGLNGSLAFSIQGNILTSQAVLDQATSAFEAPACDLAERLMRALEAGAEHGEGDSRCTGDGIPSDSAFIQVDRPGQTEPYLQLSVADTGPDSPLPRLRKQFDAWRVSHPCPTSVGMHAAGSGGAAAASGAGAAGMAGTIAAGSGGVTADVSSAGQAAASGTSGSGAAGNSAAMGGRASITPAMNPSENASAAAGTRANVSEAGAAAASSTHAAVVQAPQSTRQGCALSPAASRNTAAYWPVASVLLLTWRARRRRSRYCRR